MLVTTTLLTSEIASLETIIPLAFIGAFLGDHTGYYLGRVFGSRLHRFQFAEKYQPTIARAESLIRRYGAATIFIGRFIPAIRSLIPAMMGVSGFDRIKYSVVDAIACLCWALALAAILMGLGGLF